MDLSSRGVCFISKLEFIKDLSLFISFFGLNENEVEVKVLRCNQLPFSGYKTAVTFIVRDLSR